MSDDARMGLPDDEMQKLTSSVTESAAAHCLQAAAMPCRPRARARLSFFLILPKVSG
jgi:hypothetical protein